MTQARPPRKRRWRLAIAVIGVLLLAGAGFIVWDYQRTIHGPISLEQATTLTVPPGATAEEVAGLLRTEGLVSRPLYVRFYFWLHGKDRRLQAGAFAIQPNMSVAEVLERLCTAPPQRHVRVTMLEGWRADEMADRLESYGIGTAEQFLAAAGGGRVPLPGGSDSGLEGVLFPDTYFVSPRSTPAALVGRMVARFSRVWSELYQAHRESAEALMAEHGLTPYDLLIIASIVQAEGTVADEMPTIARVVYNRLAKGMRLQMDPTCVYQAAFRTPPLAEACRDPANTYSTYVIEGLPPTPINNPGRSALLAAMSPDSRPEAMQYIYFVARRDGSRRHAFSATYREHQANVARYLR